LIKAKYEKVVYEPVPSEKVGFVGKDYIMRMSMERQKGKDKVESETKFY
jgi:hypothetical protein